MPDVKILTGYFRATGTTDQQLSGPYSGETTPTTVKFNNIESNIDSNVSMNVSTGVITLQPNITYILSGQIDVYNDNSNTGQGIGSIQCQWYNVTTGQAIGPIYYNPARVDTAITTSQITNVALKISAPGITNFYPTRANARIRNRALTIQYIATVPGLTGPQGAQGIQGPAATIAVGTVTTGASGSSVSITNAGTSTAARLNFAIPQGAKGDTGATGPQGIQGIQGPIGAKGDTGAKGDKGTVNITVQTRAPNNNEGTIGDIWYQI